MEPRNESTIKRQLILSVAVFQPSALRRTRLRSLIINMGKEYDHINDDLKEWILKQQVFFTGSAPTVGTHINVSPKGLSGATFAVLSPNKVAYLDYSGSGAETIAHIYDNGRLTIMFNSFGTSPRICRLFCKGEVVERGEAGFDELIEQMGKEKPPGNVRAVIIGNVFKAQTTCGYGVPILQGEFAERTLIADWGEKTAKAGKIDKYIVDNNAWSLDGVPGMKRARKGRGESLVKAEVGRAIRRWEANWDAVAVGLLFGIAAGVALSKRLPGLGA